MNAFSELITMLCQYRVVENGVETVTTEENGELVSHSVNGVEMLEAGASQSRAKLPAPSSSSQMAVKK